MRALEVRPFPLDRLSRLTRAETQLVRDVLRSAPPDVAAIGATLSARLGASTAIRVLPPVTTTSVDGLVRRLAPRVVALLFARPDGARVVLDVDPQLAGVVADRVLGGTGDAILPSAEHIGPIERGLLSATTVEALATAGAPAAGLRLVTVLETAAGVGEALASSVRIVAIHLDVSLGAHRSHARVFVGDSGMLRPSSAWPAGAFDRVAPLPLHVVATVGTARVSRRDFGSIRPSDVVVLDRASAHRVAGTSEIDGHASLWIRGAARPFARARVSGRTLIRANEEAIVDPSPDHTDADRARELLGDSPVEITIEIARVVMRADELMAIRAGEVVRTGAPVSSEVRLVAAGRVVARGELVDVEGEVGVRILSI